MADVSAEKISMPSVTDTFLTTDVRSARSVKDTVLPQKVQNEICSQIPLGRIGEPSEVASVIAFLASEQASYVSGSCVDVLGGYIA